MPARPHLDADQVGGYGAAPIGEALRIAQLQEVAALEGMPFARRHQHALLGRLGAWRGRGLVRWQSSAGSRMGLGTQYRGGAM